MTPLPNLPVPSPTNIAVQNKHDRRGRYLRFSGTTLTSSVMFNYGICLQQGGREIACRRAYVERIARGF
jgi:hypothetical protein